MADHLAAQIDALINGRNVGAPVAVLMVVDPTDIERELLEKLGVLLREKKLAVNNVGGVRFYAS